MKTIKELKATNRLLIAKEAEDGGQAFGYLASSKKKPPAAIIFFNWWWLG